MGGMLTAKDCQAAAQLTLADRRGLCELFALPSKP